MNLWNNAPDGVRAFLIGCAVLLVSVIALVIYDSIRESRTEERRYKRGHAD